MGVYAAGVSNSCSKKNYLPFNIAMEVEVEVETSMVVIHNLFFLTSNSHNGGSLGVAMTDLSWAVTTSSSWIKHRPTPMTIPPQASRLSWMWNSSSLPVTTRRKSLANQRDVSIGESRLVGHQLRSSGCMVWVGRPKPAGKVGEMVEGIRKTVFHGDIGRHWRTPMWRFATAKSKTVRGTTTWEEASGVAEKMNRTHTPS